MRCFAVLVLSCILGGCALPLDGGSAEFEERYVETYAPPAPPTTTVFILEFPNNSE